MRETALPSHQRSRVQQEGGGAEGRAEAAGRVQTLQNGLEETKEEPGFARFPPSFPTGPGSITAAGPDAAVTSERGGVY